MFNHLAAGPCEIAWTYNVEILQRGGWTGSDNKKYGPWN